MMIQGERENILDFLGGFKVHKSERGRQWNRVRDRDVKDGQRDVTLLTLKVKKGP